MNPANQATTSRAPVRLGIIGCGGISHRHGPAAAASPEVAFAACCDTRLDVAGEWAATYGATHVFDDYRTMLAETELDGVLLATWPVQHHEQILGCIDAGARFILCEKSLTITGAQALDVFREAQKASASVVEALMYRHHPAVEHLQSLVAGGALGTVDSIRAYFNLLDSEQAAGDDSARDWRQRADLGGGVPWDLACYCIDACNLLAGSLPTRAFALGGRSERYGTINRLHGLIEYAGGPVGIVVSSTRSDFDHELRVTGTSGHAALRVAWRIETPVEVTVTRSVGWGRFEEERREIGLTDPYRLQLERFAAAIRGEAPTVPSPAESFLGMLTLEALVLSTEQREPVEIHVPADVGAQLSVEASRHRH